MQPTAAAPPRRPGLARAPLPAAASGRQLSLTHPESLPLGPAPSPRPGPRAPGGPAGASHGGAAAGKARRKLKLSPMTRTQVAAHSDTQATQREEPD